MFPVGSRCRELSGEMLAQQPADDGGRLGRGDGGRGSGRLGARMRGALSSDAATASADCIPRMPARADARSPRGPGRARPAARALPVRPPPGPGSGGPRACRVPASTVPLPSARRRRRRRGVRLVAPRPLSREPHPGVLPTVHRCDRWCRGRSRRPRHRRRSAASRRTVPASPAARCSRGVPACARGSVRP